MTSRRAPQNSPHGRSNADGFSSNVVPMDAASLRLRGELNEDESYLLDEVTMEVAAVEIDDESDLMRHEEPRSFLEEEEDDGFGRASSSELNDMEEEFPTIELASPMAEGVEFYGDSAAGKEAAGKLPGGPSVGVSGADRRSVPHWSALHVQKVEMTVGKKPVAVPVLWLIVGGALIGALIVALVMALL